MSKRARKLTKREKKQQLSQERNRARRDEPRTGNTLAPPVVDDDGLVCAREEMQHLIDRVMAIGNGVVELNKLTRRLRSECPDAPAVVELRALLDELDDFAIRCDQTLRPVHDRCVRYLEEGPHLHVGKGRVVDIDDADDAEGAELTDELDGVSLGISGPDAVRCGECDRSFPSPLVSTDGWTFRDGKPVRQCDCGALMMVAAMGIGPRPSVSPQI
jgi:hypothetical protein